MHAYTYMWPHILHMYAPHVHILVVDGRAGQTAVSCPNRARIVGGQARQPIEMSPKFLEHFPARGVRVFGKGIVIGNVMILIFFAEGSGSRVSILQENRNGRWHSVDAPQVVRLQARPRSSVGPERWSYEPQVAGSSPAGTSFSFLHLILFRSSLMIFLCPWSQCPRLCFLYPSGESFVSLRSDSRPDYCA